jgi:ABC-type phosphate transport system substrate-binding protein
MNHRQSLVAAAVATALWGVAPAANTDIYASGASAQRTFWSKDLQGSFCGAGTLQTFKYFDSSLAASVAQPDYQAFRCTAATSASVTSLPAGITAGDVLTLHYAAELGSVWGVAGSINTSLTRAQLDPGASTLCTTTATANTFNCAGSGFTRSSDSGGGTLMVQHASDILLYDVEPTLFTADNWPTASAGETNTDGNSADFTVTKLSPAPTAAQLAALLTTAAPINGQVFSIIGTPLASWSLTSLSRSSLRSIFAGQYSNWNEVPEVGSNDTTGTAITICRRDHGSGSQVSASVFFEGTECNQKGAKAFVSDTTYPSVLGTFNLFTNASTADVKTCIANHSPAIGLVSLGTSAAYTTFNIDGIQPNAHNAAAGLYQDAFETWGLNNNSHAGNTAEAQTLITNLLSDAEQEVKLSNAGLKETVTLTGNQYTTAAPTVAYSIPKYNTVSTANLNLAAPVAIQDRAGNSCSVTYSGN